MERKAIRVGLGFITLAAVIRLLGAGLLTPVLSWLERPEVASFILFMETGRIFPLSSQADQETKPETTAPPETRLPPAETTAPQTVPPTELSPEDAQLVAVSNFAGYAVDLEAMLQTRLTLPLKGAQPTVLILHTHATESYSPQSGDYTQLSPYRTLDTDYNMVSIGSYIAQELEEAGIGVIHDTTLHDYPEYNGAYNRSRRSMESYLAQYPSIKLVLDIHRDASGDYVNQLTTHAQVEGRESAQLMLVVGTDGTGLTHNNWQQNMTLAVQLHARLEKRFPGVCRPISFRSERFNQDMLPGALLVEVGAAGDSHAKALAAADALVQILLEISA